MTTSTTTEHDRDLRIAVEDELHWTPEIDAAEVAVSVEDGLVTLSGHVPTYAQKIAAGRAAARTRLVSDVDNDLRVHYRDETPTDADIASAARATIEAQAAVPPGAITVEVDDGYVGLTGEVMWNFQRVAAVKAVGQVNGVHGVDSRITLSPRLDADASETTALIRSAIRRQAVLDAATIHVHASGDQVQLTGTVSSWAEKHQAELAAWSSPHVNHVANGIVVRA